MSEKTIEQLPGFREIVSWPKEPRRPFAINAVWLYRNGTVQVDIAAVEGEPLTFFFESHLGRLCYGHSEIDDDAAFIRPRSPFENELFEALETGTFCFSEIMTTNEQRLLKGCLERARVYSGLPLLD